MSNEYEYDTCEDLNDDLNEEDNSYDADQDDAEIDLEYENDECVIKSPANGFNSSMSANAGPNNEDDYFFKRSAKTKRGILPKNATNVMKKWLFQHIIVNNNLI